MTADNTANVAFPRSEPGWSKVPVTAFRENRRGFIMVVNELSEVFLDGPLQALYAVFEPVEFIEGEYQTMIVGYSEYFEKIGIAEDPVSYEAVITIHPDGNPAPYTFEFRHRDNMFTFREGKLACETKAV